MPFTARNTGLWDSVQAQGRSLDWWASEERLAFGGHVMTRTFKILGTLFGVLLLSGSAASAQQLKVTKGNYLAASGRWKSDAELTKPEEAPPAVRIECDKNINLCAVAQGANVNLTGDGNLFTRL